MDRLFTYETNHMMKMLEQIEDEMREESYPVLDARVVRVSRHAKDYIRGVFEYLKKRCCEEERSVLSIIRELYRVAVTGEYSYLQRLHEIRFTSSVFEHLEGESGYQEVLYAARLLRYYYLLREKKDHPEETWDMMERLCKKIRDLGPLERKKKREWGEVEARQRELPEDQFIPMLRAHMDKNMIGQEVLKKKLCILLYQWKYYDVRTNFLMIGSSGSGKNHMIETIRSFPELGIPVISYDCSMLTPNGFTGADIGDIFKKVHQACIMSSERNAFRERVLDKSFKGIVYLDEVDKIINFHHDSSGESVNAMVQQQLLSSLAGTETIHGVDTGRILFILGGAFPRIDDLKKENDKNSIGFVSDVKYTCNSGQSLREQMAAIGGETEFIGRIEEIVRLSRLTKEELRLILMDENIGAFTRKKEVYRKSGLNLEIDSDTVDAIVDLIVKEDAGARSVKNVLNQFADSQYFYDMKVGGYDTMKIHKGMLYGEPPIFRRGGVKSAGRDQYSQKM